MKNYIVISKNYTIFNQDLLKRQLNNIKYINITDNLKNSNFPNYLIDNNCKNIIIYLKEKYIGFGKHFFDNLIIDEPIVFNNNVIFLYRESIDLLDEFINNIFVYYKNVFESNLLNNIIEITYNNYNDILSNNKLFYIKNLTQNHIILFNRLIDELFPLDLNFLYDVEIFSCKKKFNVFIFLDKKCGFQNNFFINLFNIDFGINKNGDNVKFTIYNAYSKNLWLIDNEFNSNNIYTLKNNSKNYNSIIEFSNYTELDNNISKQNLKYRKQSFINFKNSDYDYYFTVDISHIIDNSNVIKDLIIQDKDLIVPLLTQENTRFRNFWTDIDINGYYKTSNFYNKILDQEKKGLYNIPYFYNTCLISNNLINNLDIENIYSNNLWTEDDIDMAICNNLRKWECPIYINCSSIYGKIIKTENAEKYWYNSFISDIFDFFLIEDSLYYWSIKFIVNNINDNMYNMNKININEPIKDLYDFLFFTPLACKCLINIANNLNNWSDGKNEDIRLAGGYENVPTRDIHLHQLDLDNQWKIILDKYISKFAAYLYSNFKTNETNIVFIVKYSMDRQQDLCPHHDSSSYSVLFTLNDEFEGGGTHFVRQDHKSVNVPIGNCSIHPGRLTHYHAGIPITSGERYILVGFIN